MTSFVGFRCEKRASLEWKIDLQRRYDQRKEDPEDKSEQNRKCDPLPTELREMDEPRASVRGLKR